MTDVVSSTKRSWMMSRITGKDTRPEMIIRSGLHRRGYRFRLHRKDLPGKPDIVLPKYNALIFVNGCFWHGHQCHLFKMPSSRRDFWRTKIQKNCERDQQNYKRSLAEGWRLLVVWECAIKGRKRLSVLEIIGEIERWLHSNKSEGEIAAVSSKTPTA